MGELFRGRRGQNMCRVFLISSVDLTIIYFPLTVAFRNAPPRSVLPLISIDRASFAMTRNNKIIERYTQHGITVIVKRINHAYLPMTDYTQH